LISANSREGEAPPSRTGRTRNATECVPCSASAADFITSGNIDRYAIRLGNVRYLNRTYIQPRLPLESPELTPAKRRLFASPKIVIAGMSRRLEAAWDDRGLALGVQVFAVSDWQVDPFYLLALLNSKLLSYLFATRFAAKRLAGGYLAINKGQLSRLPIVVGTGAPAQRVGVPSPVERRLAELAASCGRRPACHENQKENLQQAGRLPREEEADRLVYELYRLSVEEIAQVDCHFSGLLTRAA
jgi:adenine-specific DNA-methyltransferase